MNLLRNLQNMKRGGKPTIVTWGNMDMKVLKHNCEMAGVRISILWTVS